MNYLRNRTPQASIAFRNCFAFLVVLFTDGPLLTRTSETLRRMEDHFMVAPEVAENDLASGECPQCAANVIETRSSSSQAP